MTTGIILIVISLGLLIVGTINLSTYYNIIKNGISTEGVILNIQSNYVDTIQLSYPTVRFLTINNEWITETAKTGIILGNYKAGQKVNLIYKPNNPREFAIKSKYCIIIPIIVISIGILSLILGSNSLINI